MNGVIKNRLAKICQHTELNWIAVLPLALMACRSTELCELHLTPHELLTGRRMPTLCLRTSGKGPSLSLLENKMKAYVKYLTTLHRGISTYVSEQAQQEIEEENREREKNTIQPGDKVFVKVFKRKWFNARREGPFEVVRCTGTAVQVEGSPTCFHLNHCVKAPSEETSRLQDQEQDDETPEEQVGPVVEMHDDHAHVPDSPRDEPSENRQERRFTEVDLQHAQEAAGSDLLRDVPSKTPEKCDASPREARDSNQRQSPRPVRTKTRPKSSQVKSSLFI